MKFLVAFAALVALTVAVPLSKPVDSDLAQLEAIIAAINSPSTDPATAALLEEQLGAIIAAANPIDVGPAIIPPSVIVEQPEPIAIGPALVPPKPDGGAVTSPITPSPVAIGEIPAGSSPLVQIIVNVNKAASGAVPVSPVALPEPVGPIDRPVPIGRPVPVGRPVPIGEIPAEPVQIVEVAPVPAEPVQIGVPVIPEAAVILPEELN